MQKDDDIFENYKDLYELTKKIVDDHMEFYKNKESLSKSDLFEIWRKLSRQSGNFDKRDWTENWHNWDKNLHAFEKHKFEARFLIQDYLTDVLEELIAKLIKNLENVTELVQKNTHQSPTDNLSELIKQEVKRQLASELSKKKRK